jgi:signal transduction histidine kinase
MAAWSIMPLYVPVVGIPVALYSLAVHRSRRISLLALLASFIPNELAATVAFRIHGRTLAAGIPPFIANTALLVIVTAAAWSLGRMTRASQRQVQHLERERERLERDRKTAREAVAAERRRIARELHDIVSHAVAVIILQAAGAARIADTHHLAQVKQSLGHIETTGQQAMVELQRLLGVLDKSEPDSYIAGIGELGPQPGLADLPALITSLRATGMPITVEVEGAPRDLDPSVDLAAYRIIQEGLTNALKHAGKDANPQVRLVWEVHDLMIQIDNNAYPPGMHRKQGLSGGRGLVGLRERAHAVGGTLRAGPHNEDRYQLTATLPIPDHRSTVTPGPSQVATLAMAGVGKDRKKVST